MTTDSEITAGNPSQKVQTFARYWSRERAQNYQARSPEAYARRAWNRCATLHAGEIARLKARIEELEANK